MTSPAQLRWSYFVRAAGAAVGLVGLYSVALQREAGGAFSPLVLSAGSAAVAAVLIMGFARTRRTTEEFSWAAQLLLAAFLWLVAALSRFGAALSTTFPLWMAVTLVLAVTLAIELAERDSARLMGHPNIHPALPRPTPVGWVVGLALAIPLSLHVEAYLLILIHSICLAGSAVLMTVRGDLRASRPLQRWHGTCHRSQAGAWERGSGGATVPRFLLLPPLSQLWVFGLCALLLGALLATVLHGLQTHLLGPVRTVDPLLVGPLMAALAIVVLLVTLPIRLALTATAEERWPLWRLLWLAPAALLGGIAIAVSAFHGILQVTVVSTICIPTCIVVFVPVLGAAACPREPRERSLVTDILFCAVLPIGAAGQLSLLNSPYLADSGQLMVGLCTALLLACLYGRYVFRRTVLESIHSGPYRGRFRSLLLSPRLGGKVTLQALLDTLEDESEVIRTNAIVALGVLGDKRAVPELLGRLEDDNVFVRAAAARALEELGDRQMAPALVRRLMEEQEQVLRSQIVSIIKGFSTEAGQSVETNLQSLLSDKSPRVRANAVEALDEIRPSRSLEPFLPLLTDPSPRVRVSSIVAIAKRGDGQWRSRMLQTLMAMLQSESPRERLAACWGLGSVGDDDAVEPLLQTLQDGDMDLRKVAVRAIRRYPSSRTLFTVLEQLSIDDRAYNRLAVATVVCFSELLTPESLQPFVELANETMNRNIAAILVNVRFAGDLVLYEELLADRYPSVVLATLQAIQRHRPTSVAERVAGLLHHDDLRIVSATLTTLACLGDDVAHLAPSIRELTTHPEPHIRANAVAALAQVGQHAEIASIVPFLKDADHRVRAVTAGIVAQLGDSRGADVLRAMLRSSNKWEVASGVYAIGESRSLSLSTDVLSLREHPDPDVRRQACQALEKIHLGFVHDIDKLDRYLEQIERSLTQNLEYLVDYLKETRKERHRFAIDLLDKMSSGRIRRTLLATTASRDQTMLEALFAMDPQRNLSNCEPTQVLDMLIATVRSGTQRHEDLLTALIKQTPSSPQVLERLTVYGDVCLRTARYYLEQQKTLCQVDDDVLVAPLRNALAGRVDQLAKILVQVLGALSGVNVDILLRRLAGPLSTEGFETVLRSLEQLHDQVGPQVADIIRQQRLDVPKLARTGKQTLQLETILSLMHSEDEQIQTLAVAGVGDLITRGFLKVLSETVATPNPCIQLVSLQTLERLKQMLQM